MDTKKFAIGTLVGGIAFFLLGYLAYGLALNSFFSEHTHSPAGAMKTMEEFKWWALILGNFASGALLSYIFLRMGNINTFIAGARKGAAIGFFISLGSGLIRYATENGPDHYAVVAEVLVGALITAIAGGIIAAVLGMGKKA